MTIMVIHRYILKIISPYFSPIVVMSQEINKITTAGTGFPS